MSIFEISDTTEMSEEVENMLHPEEDLPDVVFLNPKAPKEKLYGHRKILAAKSDYFRAIFWDDFDDRQQSILVLQDDINPRCFQYFLTYLYTGRIQLSNYTVDEVVNLLHTSNFCSIRHLREITINFLKSQLTMDNSVKILNASHKEHAQDLTDLTHGFLRMRPMEILYHDSFVDLEEISLVSLLRKRTLPAREVEIFKAVARWCSKRPEKKACVLGYVNLQLMSVSDIFDFVKPTGLYSDEYLGEVIRSLPTVPPGRRFCNSITHLLRKYETIAEFKRVYPTYKREPGNK